MQLRATVDLDAGADVGQGGSSCLLPKFYMIASRAPADYVRRIDIDDCSRTAAILRRGDGTMTSRHIFGALAAFLWTVEAVAAGSAPPQLRGKSVSIVWSESGSYKRASDGKQVSAVGQLTRTVYVSDSGRAFVRTSSGTIAGQSLPGMGTSGRSRDVGPEGTAGSVQFTGNSMAIFGANQGIARRIAATFDPAYSSCTATVTVGKSGPGSTIKGFDGQVYEVLSMQPGSISCSLRAGNAFAN